MKPLGAREALVVRVEPMIKKMIEAANNVNYIS